MRPKRGIGCTRSTGERVGTDGEPVAPEARSDVREAEVGEVSRHAVHEGFEVAERHRRALLSRKHGSLLPPVLDASVALVVPPPRHHDEPAGQVDVEGVVGGAELLDRDVRMVPLGENRVRRREARAVREQDPRRQDRVDECAGVACEVPARSGHMRMLVGPVRDRRGEPSLRIRVLRPLGIAPA